MRSLSLSLSPRVFEISSDQKKTRGGEKWWWVGAMRGKGRKERIGLEKSSSLEAVSFLSLLRSAIFFVRIARAYRVPIGFGLRFMTFVRW